jgi:hypothetical protein
MATVQTGARLLESAQAGSPLILQAVGRAFGLAEPEMTALKKGNLGGWFWLVLGLGVGVVVGARAYKAWPARFPKWVVGS